MNKQQKFSASYTLINEDLKKIGIGALLAMGGALVAYLLNLLPGVDMGQYTYIVIPVASILLNALKKYIEETQY